MRGIGRPPRNNELWQKENYLMKELARTSLFHIREDILDKFLDYCHEEKENAEREADPDIGYINQCQRMIDRYTPVHDHLREITGNQIGEYLLREQLHDISGRPGKKGEN